LEGHHVRDQLPLLLRRKLSNLVLQLVQRHIATLRDSGPMSMTLTLCA
jgi:hypothetical protein